MREDYDFIGFTYNGKHSFRDLNVYRTSSGSRYDLGLTPTLTEKTAEAPGADGTYFFGTRHKQKSFSINLAFDSLTESQLRNLRTTFAGKEIGELSFDENPYIVYSAKVTGTPNIKALCFDEKDSTTGEIKRIYKGEGTIQFTCYYPYGHTPTKLFVNVGTTSSPKWEFREIDGRILSNYDENYYTTKPQWERASGLLSTINSIVNPGDLPAPFVVSVPSVTSEQILSVGSCSIKVLETCLYLTWDSKSGLVMGEIGGIRRPINYSGQGIGYIPVTDVAISCSIGGGEISYQYWYY